MNEEQMDRKVLIGFKIKLALAIIVPLVLVLVGFLYYYNQKQTTEFKPVINPKFSSEAEYTQYYQKLKEAYKNDTYGGSTPEETLQLFIDALKARDVDLASKYFILEKQEDIKNQLTIGEKNGNINLLINDLEKEKTGISLSDTQYRFRTYNESNVAEFSFDLILNSETGKWKIESL